MGHNWPGIYHLMPNAPFAEKDGKELTLDETFLGDYISYQQSLNIPEEKYVELARQGISDPNQITQELLKDYNGISPKIVKQTKEFRKHAGLSGREWAIKNGFDVKGMCDSMISSIDGCFENFKPRERYTLINMNDKQVEYVDGILI